MEGSSLFNPGFLGSHFSWWIGQIADDATWRDNILSGKFQDPSTIPGWGRRYKVRIIGLHDIEEETIPSDQLPWAQVMYPITSGGGQTGASQTANLRQGMFVFGFFIDGQDQQVPVIMGVLGNNAQTQLSTRIGSAGNTNEEQANKAVSGWAEGQDPPVGNSKPLVPDDRILTLKPKDAIQSEECSPPPPGVALNAYGLRSDKALNSQQFADQQSAIAEADARGLTGVERSNFVQSAVSKGIQARCQEANSPGSPARPGATIENIDANHLLSNADVKRNDLYLKKRIMMSTCDVPSSALKAINTLLENLTKEIDKVLQAQTSYIDAVSQVLSIVDVADAIAFLIQDFSCQIAKYMKIIFDKILEYILKQINKAISPTVDVMYPNQRHQYLDLKEKITEIINCLFSKITDGLCGQIQGALTDILDTATPSPDNSGPYVPVCSIEKLGGDLIAANQDEINNGIDSVLDIVNNFLNDIRSQLASISQDLSDITATISSITSSISSALNFENIKLNIFGCELSPNCAVSDFYTLHRGGGAAEETQIPSPTSVAKAVLNPTPITPIPIPDFALPSKITEDLDFKI